MLLKKYFSFFIEVMKKSAIEVVIAVVFTKDVDGL